MAGKLLYQGMTYDEMLSDMRQVFASGKTKSLHWRLSQLKAILRMLETDKSRFCDALFKDLGKDTYDSCVDEIGIVTGEADWFINNLSSIMKDKKGRGLGGQKLQSSSSHFRVVVYVIKQNGTGDSTGSEPLSRANHLRLAWLRLLLLHKGFIRAGVIISFTVTSTVVLACYSFFTKMIWMYLLKDVSLSLVNVGGNGYIRYEPFGVILNITAWNYPLQIALAPLLSIIAAGNCCVIKPSELSPHTSALLAELIPLYMDNECIKVVEGGIPETTALLKMRWDHIMYTGSSVVGKVIHKAAAEYLTPCTLELGGKCPTYIDDDVTMESVCNRVTWYKYKNAGQTCLAVDYVLIKASRKEEFLDRMCKSIAEQFGSDPAKSEDYCRIVNERHFNRLCGLLDSAKDKRVVIGGDRQASSLYFGPTVITDISPDEKVMGEEIFGPILPVIAVKDSKEAIDFINSREKPLHINVFSGRQSVIDEFISRTSSGGFMANDGLIFRAETSLPFGGVGNSGFGCYTGKPGFLNFSHQKPVLIKSMGMEFLFKLMRYPPHSQTKLNRIQTISTKLPKVLSKLKYVVIPIVILAVGLGIFLGLAKGGSVPGAGYIPKVEL